MEGPLRKEGRPRAVYCAEYLQSEIFRLGSFSESPSLTRKENRPRVMQGLFMYYSYYFAKEF
jgi:hypothetical protein